MSNMNPKDIAAQTRAPLHLLPAITAVAGAEAIRPGAIEYGPYNWREKPISLMQYIGAIERHIARVKDGEDIDAKSGALHLGHIIATSGIILDARGCGTLIDDRPARPGKASEVLDGIESRLRRQTEERKASVGGSSWELEMMKLGWSFFMTGPNEWDWIKHGEKGPVIGRGGDNTWAKDMAQARSNLEIKT